MSIKNQAKGYVPREVMEYVFPGGDMPKEIRKIAGAEERIRARYPALLSHIGEKIPPLPGGE